ncbi:ap2 domain transcription factor ap2ix-6 [Cystoisospora suis]|uniref:Ap2 domain transcription factor ap2ix-6 n=1 Tax=Cystoisospora suis TaxID=483139 RepID=A0A2C6LFM0_9APIC|nr:ap2 domain transcription factor ap2ix-6 [Cystoisospora suis]
MVIETALASPVLQRVPACLLCRTLSYRHMAQLCDLVRRQRSHQFSVGPQLSRDIWSEQSRPLLEVAVPLGTNGAGPSTHPRTNSGQRVKKASAELVFNSLPDSRAGVSRPPSTYRTLLLPAWHWLGTCFSPSRRSFMSGTAVGLSADCCSGSPVVGCSLIAHRASRPWSLASARSFGGRAGGLKRRKPRRDPGVVIQSGLGRRQEFFWPEKSRRTRVPLYQNSRPNLIYDHRFKRFMCMWYSNGVQVFRPFSCRGRKGGRGKEGLPDGLGIGRNSGTWERARAKAIVLLKQLKRQGRLNSLAKPDVARSGVRGVYFDTEEKLWVATWNEHGMRRFKAFPTMEMGFDAAYQAAVAVRRQKLQENYIFCMQRTRKKSGRPPLK